MIYILVVMYLALTGFDFWFTRRRMFKHGVGVEMNPAIRRLAGVFGPTKGLILGCLAPSVIIATSAGILGGAFLAVLLFLVGYRFAVFNFQLASLAWETEIDEILRNLQQKQPPPE